MAGSELEDELHRTRERLRTTVEQYEVSLEALRASNAELRATNDELCYASTALETSKQELQSVNEELGVVNQELRWKIDELVVAEAALRDADRRKDEFLATLSHELRNPLAPLQVALDAARLLDDDKDARAHSLSIMERQIAMLTTLVNELLDLSRVTQGKMVLERAIVSVAHALESAVVATRPMFEAAQHELRIAVPDCPVEVDGDFRRLVQVFTNLLSNAAKYTPPSGHIDVAIVAGPASVAVCVQDDGLGITSDMLPRIFDIFVQSREAHGRSQGGLGIGLNLVRRLVELHGGTVTAVSAGTGRGSAFTVELPLHLGGPV
jgi:signal transduction histidine kinase